MERQKLMSESNTTEGAFNADARRRELIAAFEAMDQEKAKRQIAILPFYHSIENEITKSKQGIFVTSYFLTKWAPALGYPAMNIVLALQKLADKDTGKTTAKLETIAMRGGV